MDDNTRSDDNWAENLANLGKAIGPFKTHFAKSKYEMVEVAEDVSVYQRL